jgi:hypothetical protein
MAEETIYQIKLEGFGMSGRGVRLRQLAPEVVHEVEEQAAKLIGPGATAYAFNQAVLSEGVARMVVEVSEPARGVPEGESPEWQPVTLQQMKASASSWFGARDVAVLEQMYSRLHQVSQSEIDTILGKALPVTR